MITFAAIAAAVAVLVWPQPKVATPYLTGVEPIVPPVGVSFIVALQSMQAVRSRLSAAGKVSNELVAAIDTITIALVHGSDLP